MARSAVSLSGVLRSADKIPADRLLTAVLDPVTHLNASAELGEAIFAEYAKEGAPEAFILTGDFFNLHNLSAAVTREQADQFMLIGMEALKYHLSEVAKPQGLDTLYGMREPGDESVFIVSGRNLTQDAIDDAIAATRQQLAQVADEAFLRALVHRKPDRPPGIGLDIVADRVRGTGHEKGFNAYVKQLKGRLQGLKSGSSSSGLEPVAVEIFHEPHKKNLAIAAFATALASIPKMTLHVDAAVLGAIAPLPCQKMELRQFRDEILRHAADGSRLLRLDIRGLSVLNSSGHIDSVDDLLGQIDTAIKHELHGKGFSLCPMGEGVWDIVTAPSADVDSVDALKVSLHANLLGLLQAKFPEKQNKKDVGFTLLDVPVALGNPELTLEHADQTKNFYRRNGIAYVSQRSVVVPHGGGAPVTYDPQPDSAGPYADFPAIQEALFKQGVIGLDTVLEGLRLPVGMICAHWLGVDVSEAVVTNALMQRLLQNQSADEGRISTEAFLVDLVDQARSPAEVATAVKSKLGQDPVLRLSDAPFTMRYASNRKLLTLGLACQWGLLDPAVKDIVLKTQLSTRIIHTLQRPQSLDAAGAVSALETSLKPGFISQDDAQLRFVQMLEKAANILKYTEALQTGTACLTDPEIARAFETAAMMMIRASMAEAGVHHHASSLVTVMDMVLQAKKATPDLTHECGFIAVALAGINVDRLPLLDEPQKEALKNQIEDCKRDIVAYSAGIDGPANILVTHYQPIYELDRTQNTLVLQGFEALGRVVDPQGGVRSVYGYLNAVESSGLYTWLEAEALKNSCAFVDVARKTNPSLYVTVNLHPAVLALPECVTHIDRILEQYPHAASGIRFEITEDVFPERDQAAILKNIDALSARGFSFYLDDYMHTDHDQKRLEQLQALVSGVKLDRDFLRKTDAEKASCMAYLAQKTAVVVQEGIETEAQLDSLGGYTGARVLAQGYHHKLGRPCSGEQALAIVKKETPAGVIAAAGVRQSIKPV